MIEWTATWAFWLIPLPILVWLILPNRKIVASAALKVPFLSGLEQVVGIREWFAPMEAQRSNYGPAT